MEYRGTKDLGQVFMLLPNTAFITTGTVPNVRVLYCHVDGTLQVKFLQGSKTFNFEVGDCFGFDRPVEVVVSSGTFSFM